MAKAASRKSTRDDLKRRIRPRDSENQGFLQSRTTWGIVAIVLAVLLVYSRMFHAGFIWDDDAMVTENRLIRSPDGLWRFWLTTEAPDYFPLVSSFLWLQWRLWGMDATGFHVVQILLHAVNSALLWRVLKRLQVPGAYFAGMVFALHPVNVETVAWITETKNTLPMGFYLASLLWYLRFDEGGGRRAYWISVILFVLALLGKTSVVGLPVVLLIIAWWKKGKITRLDLVRSIPFFVAAILLGLVTVWFQSNRAIIQTVIREDGLLSRTLLAGRVVWFYAYKALLPVNLSFVYPRWPLEPELAMGMLPGLALIITMVALWAMRGRVGRHGLAAVLYYLVSLFPVLGFINIYFMRYSLVADHWQYVAIPGIIALVAGGGTHLLSRWSGGNRQAQVGVATAVCLLLAFMSWKQTSIYINNEVLFTDILKKNPNAWIAHNNLGIIYAQSGRLDQAMERHKRALELNPELSDAYLNIGNIHAVRGENDEAIAAFRRSLDMTPSFRTHNALGEVYLKTGKTNEAIEQFQHALKLTPDFGLAHRNLGDAYVELGSFDQAIAAYQNAIRFRTTDPEPHNKLAHAFVKAGRSDDAVAQLETATRMFPGYLPAYRNLVALLKQAGRDDDAAAVMRDIARLEQAGPAR